MKFINLIGLFLLNFIFIVKFLLRIQSFHRNRLPLLPIIKITDMKKIFLFLIALVGIVACSKSDSGSSDNGGGGSVAGYNPPDWIIGTWMDTQ